MTPASAAWPLPKALVAKLIAVRLERAFPGASRADH